MPDTVPEVARGASSLLLLLPPLSPAPLLPPRSSRSRLVPSLQHDPSNASAWIKFTELEGLLQDYDRVRAIYELAVDQPSMDMPELVWKSWIDFEYDVEEYERARDLYERLLRRTSHVKVWVSFAQFEGNVGMAEAAALSGEGDDDDEEEGEAAEKQPVEVDHEAVEEAKRQGLERARKVFERGYADLKQKKLKEEVRLTLSLCPRLPVLVRAS